MTLAVLRPNATIATGFGHLAVPSGTVASVTSDDSDSTYLDMEVDSGGGLFWSKVNLGTVSLPAGAVTKQLRTRVRARAEQGTSNVWCRTLLSTGFVLSALDNRSVSTTITNIIAAYVPVTMAQSQIDGLQIWLGVSDVFERTRGIEVFCDLIYATKPTVAVTAPTGTISTSNVAVEFTYTQGSDGGPQSRRHVKVFDAATVAGGGFSPDTSSALYDSGVVVSSIPAHFTDTLPDGTNHRCYVRAAQTINGVLHWSDWAFSTFTVDTTAPEISTVTAVPGVASIVVTVARNTGLEAWAFVTVERSFDSGATWEFVRGATAATASGNSFAVTDYDVPNSTDVLYRAQAFDALMNASLWVEAADEVQWTDTSAWLKSPDDPSLNRTVRFPEIPAWVTSDTTTSTITFRTDTPAQTADLEALLGPARATGVFRPIGASFPVVVQDAGTPLLLQFPPAWGMDDRWIAVTQVERRHLDPSYVGNLMRLIDATVVEIARPPDLSSV